MSYVQAFSSLLSQPSLLGKKEHVFLLSHMRANTSLAGHLLGSHPQINGYYEMHIGYYSNKSLLRQKILYAQQHSFKPNSHYMFDKVLHNEHHVTESILTNSNCRFLVSIRAPEYTVPSIVSLYESAHPEHELTQPEHAATYYCERLEGIAEQIKNTSFPYLYFDADAIKVKPDTTLGVLSTYLALSSPLSPTYQKMHNTGKAKAGDSSSSLLTGKIQQTGLTPPNVAYENEPYFQQCICTYGKVREQLITHAIESVLL